MQQPSIACPKCGGVSYNPNDVANRYCGACHAFHDDVLPEGPALKTFVQKQVLAAALHAAWVRYTYLFGEPPHGTLRQMNALVELMREQNAPTD